MTDPFEALSSPHEPQAPRPSFARSLRSRLVTELGLDDPDSADTVPTIDLPERKQTVSTTSTSATPAVATSVTPYLTVSDGPAALDWYAEAFGAVEQFRVVGDYGRLGHAEFTIGGARFMLSDEYEEMGVVSPTSLGGTPTALYLEVADIDDLYRRAVAAGATAQREPADQTHGNRTGTLLDPYGHRWMLSQPLEAFDLDTYAEREGGGFTVRSGPAATSLQRDGRPYVDGIWTVVTYDDVDAGIRFVTDVLGFEELVLVRDDAGGIVHSEYRWPEGGIVQIASWVEGNEFIPRPGDQGLYVITADPQAVWERCQAAGVEVIRPPEEPHYDPGGMGFSVRDPEGNAWSFGTYAGGATG